MKRLATATMAAMMMVALGFSASAASSPFTQATGSVGLSSPTQFLAFDAFDYGATGDRGTVKYANWSYGSPGSGVWDVTGLDQITFWLNGAPYVHTLDLTVTPISQTASRFSGTGTDVLAHPTTITGMQNHSAISFTITGTNFVITGSGTIAADGSMSGDAAAVENGATTLFTWTAAAGSASEILSYVASIYDVVASGTTASFTYAIPADTSLPNVVVTMSMTDGGSPGAGHDTIGWGSPQTIVSGNLVVH